MKKFIKILTAAIALALTAGIPASAYTQICPPHIFEKPYYTESTVIDGSDTHPYVIEVVNNKPLYGTCIAEEIKVTKVYICICGEKHIETSYHRRHSVPDCMHESDTDV